MALHISVIGIDGSGKSTVVKALPGLLSAEFNVRAGSIGDELWALAPEEDLLSPGFTPRGQPLSGWLSRRFRWLAKQVASGRYRYPFCKLTQLIFQDHTARQLATRERLSVMVSDGNVVLSGMARAANFAAKGAPKISQDDLSAILACVVEGREAPKGHPLPKARLGSLFAKVTKQLGIEAFWLPEVIVFLDASPVAALSRIQSRGQRLDRHESLEGLEVARQGYVDTLLVLKARYPHAKIIRISVDTLRPHQVLEKILQEVRGQLTEMREASGAQLLGAPRETGGAAWRRLLSPGYLFRYLLRHLPSGSWRELSFLFSRLGRQLLSEGYSAEMMRAIYESGESAGWLNRIFLGHPLHQAVAGRLPLLQAEVARELEGWLVRGGELRILTAPSGFAADLLAPLEALSKSHPEVMGRIKLLAVDLDPTGVVLPSIEQEAEALGVQVETLQGDLTEASTQQKILAEGPYDLALLVGLSSWLPKPALLRHLRLLREVLSQNGTLLSDFFSVAPYALSGYYSGFQASYYSVEAYTMLLTHAGFVQPAKIIAGPNRLNHVVRC